MKYILQVFSGSWHTAGRRAEDVIRKIGSLSSRLDVSSVIVGWRPDPGFYREVGSFLRGCGISMLLWLPVFSSAPGIAESDLMLDLSGEPVSSPFGDEEAFRFVCPSSGRNLRNIQDIYETYFSGCGFDGVFLDRVRGQSFAAGVSGVLSCGCEACRRAFLERGVDLSAVRKRYEEKQDAFFDMLSFPADGEFVLADPLAQRFFEVREEIIAGSVGEIAGWFREKGLTVGLDLFAPAISRFAGQSYPRLSAAADFVKPMLYRRTDAPAGIGYEYKLFEKNAPAARGRISPTMDRAFLDSQLDAAARAACAVYPGIEVNYDPDTVRTDPGYIAESLAAAETHGFEGAVLCWDITDAPDENLDVAYASASTCE